MMNPYISWALLLVVAGGLGWYYNNGATPKVKAPVKPVAEKIESAPSVKKPKKKTKKTPEPSTSTPKAEEKPAAEFKAQEADKPDEEIDKNEMAKRFAAVKNGTPQTSTKSTKSQKKNKKTAASQLEVNNSSERSGSRVSTRTASTNGADADDDLSPAESPEVNATSSAGYVSDMLEAPAPGASVLRVTGSMESEPKKQKAQTFKQVETKKQRQQRMKNDARKQQIQEAEAERRKLLEKQLHTAREAERREAAKSKLAAPTNAWQSNGAVANGTPKPTQAPKVDLLDTFENETPSTKATPAASKKWTQSLPSEEEQMRILGAANGDDEWTTVPSKKAPKKKGGKTDESQSDLSASESNPIPEVAPVEKPKVTIKPTYLPDILQSKQKGHPLDSDWAA
ncbi:hypothetical protein ASPWEDRAFT_109813 [Aspergillus wentii DTO 134E9]|uniref:INO80 complex subunit B-like conserved region domain-containing protein n=1 Tax=Aspergillus wentii DTO 134E9 TaxID=1073089 RepID=A0A1L9RK88_ASPWE|nr:uncharacterized protein ASPWEDRAFT_109813 [Aspergillus wentii DTO 134E9]OJJ35321.1 hypothetical protein ASPWEDRAFT_109813 [Aspergillus wentii DTO 134E9]